MSISIGIASGSKPIIGFNYGAKKYDRVKKTFRLSALASTMVTLVAGIIFFCFPLELTRSFGTESALYEEFAVKCFRIYLLLNACKSLHLCTGVFFQAIGQPVKATLVSLSRQVFFYIPAMMLLTYLLGVIGILWAGTVADGLAFTLSLLLCIHEFHVMDKK